MQQLCRESFERRRSSRCRFRERIFADRVDYSFRFGFDKRFVWAPFLPRLMRMVADTEARSEVFRFLGAGGSDLADAADVTVRGATEVEKAHTYAW